MTLSNSLGTFRHKQDSEGGEDDFQVFDDAGVGDVHQIHLQLVVGAGVVSAVDLGVAGGTGLGLEAQAEFRNLALVLARDFRALGARADDAHAALQNVEQLGQLVQAADAPCRLFPRRFACCGTSGIPYRVTIVDFISSEIVLSAVAFL